MKFSESWLREWVNPAIDSDELVARVTMAGLEVDSVEPVAPEFSGVVVGQITAIEPHPNADKLRVCQVSGGESGSVQVVCGAPNARLGLKIPFATIGAVLPGNFKIKKAKLRDVESFGMLCAEKELGVSDADEGLWELPDDAPVGEDIRSYLNLNDRIIEVDLTPNRGDCLSIRGLAREVGVIGQVAVNEVNCQPVPAVVEDVVDVALMEPQACPRYAGRVIRNIDVSVETPQWMQEKLRRSGLRSIDPVVDVTNYVLLELGQPMHAFDLNRLSGGIKVRMAKPGEPLALLDGSEVKLQADTLVIADNSGAIAMAGIMGGDLTAVGDNTRDIFLESAFFDPVSIAGKPRNYGLHTDSSHRFERGVDTRLQAVAIERATALLLDIVGGEPGPVVLAESSEHMPATASVALRKRRLQQQLGMSFQSDDISQMMAGLGLRQLSVDTDGWVFAAPSWRFDIQIEADLVEEVARIHGYNRLPTSSVSTSLEIRPGNEKMLDLATLRSKLTVSGYREAISYSFVNPAVQQVLDPETTPVVLANPIASDMAVMRTTLLSGLLPLVRHNLNRQQSRIRLFETGLRFQLNEGLQQQRVIAGVITGARHPESWACGSDAVDFFDIKGDVEALLSTGKSANDFLWSPASLSYLHPGQSARVTRGEKTVGFVGRLHPFVQKALDISQPVFVFELLLAELLLNELPTFSDISKFPEVRRDLAVVVDQNVTSGQLSEVVTAAAGEHFVNLKVFDVYQGKGIENNSKSVAMGLTFRHASRTLTEDEVSVAIEKVVAALHNEYSAVLRG
ncbi:MAG: phenylalanine--tRNA ligase subunit beta [Pseudomonadales bacterium]|nr:phenylalanine--tRNA ligase subunit beta [Pseudomonadales bacterium]MCP5171885.1 phenylalanine--tRNA ligase subunit beta [Pseudomonadales bacterium]